MFIIWFKCHGQHLTHVPQFVGKVLVRAFQKRDAASNQKEQKFGTDGGLQSLMPYFSEPEGVSRVRQPGNGTLADVHRIDRRFVILQGCDQNFHNLQFRNQQIFYLSLCTLRDLCSEF
jgi:hypothetical protein